MQAFYAEKMGLHVWQILGALQAHAFHDPVDIYEGEGDTWTLKPMRQWTLESRQCLQRLRVTERTSKDGQVTREFDLEFADRQRVLALLGKHLRLFEKQHQTASFTLVLNTSSEPTGMKQVGEEVIHGVGLQIRMPAAEKP